MPKFDDVSVQLSGRDGNAFGIIGAVSSAMRKHGVDREDIDSFRVEAMGGDYDNLLCVCMDYVNVL